MSFDAAAAAAFVAAGNQAYQAADYGGAIAAYEGAVEAGADSADLFFNLGNAFYRAGQHGRAALSWERALLRDPGDDGARRNLELVRGQVSEVSVDQTFLERMGGRVDPELAGGLLLVCWACVCAALIVRAVLRRTALRWIAASLAGLFAVGSVGAGAALWAAREHRSPSWAVVLDEADALSAPLGSASPAFKVREGQRLREVGRLGSFVQVRAGEATGWLDATRLESIAR